MAYNSNKSGSQQIHVLNLENLSEQKLLLVLVDMQHPHGRLMEIISHLQKWRMIPSLSE